MRRRAGWRVVALLATACALWASASCGSSESGGSASATAAPTTAGAAHPFAADVPAAFEQVSIGRGLWQQSWGDDSGGTDAPFTVVTDGRRTVEIAATGFAGLQGGGEIGQVTYRFGQGTWESFTLDGQDAAWSADAPGQPAQLLVVRDDDLAINLIGAGLTKDELIDLAAAVQPADDHGTAPDVVDPPAPWTVVGSVDADVLGAAVAFVRRDDRVPPGPELGYGAGWVAGEVPLAVMSLDGDSLDVDALIPARSWNEQQTSEGRSITVNGRPAVLLDICYCRDVYDVDTVMRVVLAHDVDGAAVVVASPRDGGPSEEELIAIAASVRPIETSTWDAAVEQARMTAAGGPGLHPDAGATEIARGVDGDVEWLLQTTTAEQFGSWSYGVDACLKLADYTTACSFPQGQPAAGQGVFLVAMEGETAPGVTPFVIVVTADPAGTSVLVTTGSDTATGELFTVPGLDRRAAVVFVDDPGTAICNPDPNLPPPPEMDVMRIDQLDEAGVVVGCLGMV